MTSNARRHIEYRRTLLVDRGTYPSRRKGDPTQAHFGNFESAQDVGDATTLLGLPDDQPLLVTGSAVKGERSESEGREAPLTAGPGTESSEIGEAENDVLDSTRSV